ncbi:hypothetical protein CW357_11595 [Rummeliibacillus sp. TYF005]|uniref:hypothetical protein n=1 Tax=Rummeliibacillus sp. TYF005 TaxID=2058214 RepID=UPI000F540231|nr:hypothetical protein [Rummeliibacillus sp. TYF005]RPJ95248.1 hypothetical protein CW357_11595 [Rummeliibacillus sp. TYF005]
METNKTLIYSIKNVMQLINNSILMLRDMDKALSKYSFEPINGNAIGTETSKNILQTPKQTATFFPQYMARPYALKSDIDEQQTNKILFINIQFFHPDYNELTPTLISGVIVSPRPMTDIKNEVKNWWLKNIAFEISNYEDIKKNGDINEVTDEGNYKNIFWCKDLTLFEGQESINEEAEKLVKVFNNTLVNA